MIAAIHAACDLRYRSEEAWFRIKEIDVALAADGLNSIATWNAGILYSDDLDETLRGRREQRAAPLRN